MDGTHDAMKFRRDLSSYMNLIIQFVDGMFTYQASCFASYLVFTRFVVRCWEHSANWRSAVMYGSRFCSRD
jgi:hypothetical protein